MFRTNGDINGVGNLCRANGQRLKNSRSFLSWDERWLVSIMIWGWVTTDFFYQLENFHTNHELSHAVLTEHLRDASLQLAKVSSKI